ncbi:hypothetical protein HmCmsJML201_03324 [Escherichia coli]|nr:hypothetical protein [Escherichia coli]GDD12976.1 hypothetical protein HmCmsJML201_03324 [Escherichia coli]
MRIRITDRRLIDFGISVGDVFPAFSSNHYGFMIEYKGSLLFVYRDECEVLVWVPITGFVWSVYVAD